MSAMPKILATSMVVVAAVGTFVLGLEASESELASADAAENQAASPIAHVPSEYIGSWKGDGTQEDPPGAWTIMMTLAAGDEALVVGTIAYPSLGCGGELTLIDVTSESIELLERITYGADVCIDRGTVTLRLESADALNYAWQKEGTATTGSGSLVRISSGGSQIPLGYEGIWRGEGTQDIPPDEWSILIGINNAVIGAVAGTVAYPSVGCGGVLTLTNVTSDSIELLEGYTHNPGICVDGGTVSLSLTSPSELDYLWEKEGHPGTGTGRLTAMNKHRCVVPFFSQRDDNWQDHPLRGSCTGWCIDPELGFVTIGRCGCNLTSAAMALNTYGANTDPPDLSDCMDTSACFFRWDPSIPCSNGAVNGYRRLREFNWDSWDRLSQELNHNHRPVIVELCRKGTCHLDDDHRQTHWVVVVSGQGTDPEYYLMHDPWYKCGANIPLATRSEDWEFDGMAIYEGAVPCSSLTALTPPCVARGANPEPVQQTSETVNKEASSLSNDDTQEIAPASIVCGTVWLYTRTELTMTVEVTATSSVGDVSEMLVWSDSMSNTTWQPFTPFVWLPVSERVYVRFRDNLDNVTDVYSDTVNPKGPPNAPLEVFLPIIIR